MALQADHLIPRSRGGGNEIGNLITACAGCNQGKAASILSEEDVALVSCEIPRLVGEILGRVAERPAVVEALENISGDGLTLLQWRNRLWEMLGSLDEELDLAPFGVHFEEGRGA